MKKIEGSRNVVDIFVDDVLLITGKVMYTIPGGLSIEDKVKRIYGTNYNYKLSKISNNDSVHKRTSEI
jgi:hypothetical protein